MDVVQMVLAGKVNKGLVAYLSALGGKAIGLCGIDGNMIQVHTKNEKLGLVGSTTRDSRTTSMQTRLLPRSPRR